MKQQFHLKGRGFSGRAVRVRTLDPDQAEANFQSAGKLCGPDATGMMIKKLEWRNGLKQFVTEFSDKCEDPSVPGLKWRKVAPGDLDVLGTYFTPKDVGALEKLYADYHEVMSDELEAIVGKAIDLSED